MHDPQETLLGGMALGAALLVLFSAMLDPLVSVAISTLALALLGAHHLGFLRHK